MGLNKYKGQENNNFCALKTIVQLSGHGPDSLYGADSQGRWCQTIENIQATAQIPNQISTRHAIYFFNFSILLLNFFNCYFIVARTEVLFS